MVIFGGLDRTDPVFGSGLGRFVVGVGGNPKTAELPLSVATVDPGRGI